MPAGRGEFGAALLSPPGMHDVLSQAVLRGADVTLRKKKDATAPKAPTDPPACEALGERKEQLEVTRAERFPTWRAALESTAGNVTKAGAALYPDLPPDRRKSYAWFLTRSLGLLVYARELRVAAGQAGRTGRGRPRADLGEVELSKKKV